MKTNLLISIALFLAASLCACSKCKTASDCGSGQVCTNEACVDAAELEAPVTCDSLSIDEAVYLFSNVDPADGPRQMTLRIHNEGASDGSIAWLRIESINETCGTFEITSDDQDVAIPASGSAEVNIRFTPASDASGGCGCQAIAQLQIKATAGSECTDIAPSLIAAGRCDNGLFCDPPELEFPGSVVENTYSVPVRCTNLSTDALDVININISGEDAGAFSLVLTENLPLSLAPGEAFSMDAVFKPIERGDFDARIEIALSSGQGTLVLTGDADHERPLCSDGIPAHGPLELVTPEQEILLETPDLSIYPGVIRSLFYYLDQPPLIADIVVTTGTFSDPDCDVGQSGHQFYWSGAACNLEDGTIHNIHAVPQTDDIDRWIRTLEPWDDVTIHGYEVDRINYPDGSWWTDAGCNTMVVTWICDGMEP